MALTSLLGNLLFVTELFNGSIPTTVPFLLISIILFTILAFLLFTFARFWIDPYGLRRYPAPAIAGYTSWWLVYHSLRNQRWVKLNEAHQRYGPIVRISPRHLSFTHPAALKDIYGHGATPVKDAFYSNQAGDNPNMADAVDKTVHSMKRRALANVFSPKEVLRMESRIAELVKKLIRDIEIKSNGRSVSPDDHYPVVDGSFDVRPWLNFFSYDVITSIVWSNSYGFLDKGNDLCPADGIPKLVPAMSTFHDNAAFHVATAQLPNFIYQTLKRLPFHGVECGKNFGGMVRHLVRKRMSLPGEETMENPDLFSAIPTTPTPKRPIPMSEREIIAECTVMLNAGHDTTQTSLTNVLHLLSTHPRVQEKLYAELRAHLPAASSEAAIQSYKDLERIPYLKACLDESMRVHTPTRFGLPRVTTTKGGTMVAGELVPEGVVVSVPLDQVHLNGSLFPNPKEFIPERWIVATPAAESNGSSDSVQAVKLKEDDPYASIRTPKLAQNLKDYVNPFSIGSRACIGRNIAYLEMSICLAALVLRFQWSLNYKKHPSGEIQFIERFPSNPKELWVNVRRRPE